jgi:hypothetical protein
MNRNLFPGMLPHARTYAAYPVWADSCRAEVRFQPMPKRQAVRLWHDARRFERQTRQPNRQDGAIGRNGLAILQALLFDFLNYRSGALYPSWSAIARAAGISERSVGRGLAKLKAAGVLHWLRRCVEEWSREWCSGRGWTRKNVDVVRAWRSAARRTHHR